MARPSIYLAAIVHDLYQTLLWQTPIIYYLRHYYTNPKQCVVLFVCFYSSLTWKSWMTEMFEVMQGERATRQ